MGEGGRVERGGGNERSEDGMPGRERGWEWGKERGGVQKKGARREN